MHGAYVGATAAFQPQQIGWNGSPEFSGPGVDGHEDRVAVDSSCGLLRESASAIAILPVCMRASPAAEESRGGAGFRGAVVSRAVGADLGADLGGSLLNDLD